MESTELNRNSMNRQPLPESSQLDFHTTSTQQNPIPISSGANHRDSDPVKSIVRGPRTSYGGFAGRVRNEEENTQNVETTDDTQPDLASPDIILNNSDLPSFLATGLQERSAQDESEEYEHRRPPKATLEELGVMSSSRSSDETAMTEYSFSETDSEDGGFDILSRAEESLGALPKGIDDDQLFLNPNKYYKSLEKLKSKMNEHCITTACHPKDMRGDGRTVGLFRSVDQSCNLLSANMPWKPQGTHTSGFGYCNRPHCDGSRDNMHDDAIISSEIFIILLDYYRTITNVQRKIALLKENGFNDNYFSILVADPVGDRQAASLKSVPFRTIENLADGFHKTLEDLWGLKEDWKEWKFDTDAESAFSVSEEFRSLSRNCAAVLQSLDLLDKSQKECMEYGRSFEILECATQVMDLAILLYSGGHVEDLEGLVDCLHDPYINLPMSCRSWNQYSHPHNDFRWDEKIPWHWRWAFMRRRKWVIASCSVDP
jgi:hypothetical protein